MKIVFEVYDSRYLTDPDEATCFEICDSLEEAKECREDYGSNTVVVKAMSFDAWELAQNYLIGNSDGNNR